MNIVSILHIQTSAWKKKPTKLGVCNRIKYSYVSTESLTNLLEPCSASQNYFESAAAFLNKTILNKRGVQIFDFVSRNCSMSEIALHLSLCFQYDDDNIDINNWSSRLLLFSIL